MRPKLEEIPTLTDFMLDSFTRDQATILLRYPKLNAAFLNDLKARNATVKALESKFVVTEQQRRATEAVYSEAHQLNKELGFLKDYMADAHVGDDGLASLCKDLQKGNIEGAVATIEDLAQLLETYTESLEEEGMAPDFPNKLRDHAVSLAANNALQNKTINRKLTLTAENKQAYTDLYQMVAKMAKSAKKVFGGTVTENEYMLSRALSRMRAAKKADALPTT